MRTTVRIDDDLFERIRARAHRERLSITKLMNRLLRKGLTAVEPKRPAGRYRQKTYAMGSPRINLDKARALAAALEDAAIIETMRGGGQ